MKPSPSSPSCTFYQAYSMTFLLLSCSLQATVLHIIIKIFYLKKKKSPGLPWWSSGEDSALPVLPLEGLRVRSLIGELRSRGPHGAAKKKKKSLLKILPWLHITYSVDCKPHGGLPGTSAASSLFKSPPCPSGTSHVSTFAHVIQDMWAPFLGLLPLSSTCLTPTGCFEKHLRSKTSRLKCKDAITLTTLQHSTPTSHWNVPARHWPWEHRKGRDCVLFTNSSS